MVVAVVLKNEACGLLPYYVYWKRDGVKTEEVQKLLVP